MGGLYDYWSKEDWIQHCEALGEVIDQLTKERDYLVEVVSKAAKWPEGCDTYAHAIGHIENVISNLRCDLSVMTKENEILLERIKTHEECFWKISNNFAKERERNKELRELLTDLIIKIAKSDIHTMEFLEQYNDARLSANTAAEYLNKKEVE